MPTQTLPIDRTALRQALDNATQALLDDRGPHGHWEGELSSSALSTATAVFALSQVLEARGSDAEPAFAADAGRLIRQGLGWLALNQNFDGGWGDTTRSLSNISTTCLCWSAFVADENWAAGAYDQTLRAAERWLIETVGTLDPSRLAKAVADRYGEDHTFSVPILTMMALAGRLGQGPSAWDLVPPLPFEAAAVPQRLFKWMKLPVVSYALPALIAIGQVRHVRRPSERRSVRLLRASTRRRALKLLARIQPSSGGFLEATPLTSFVTMSLAAAGQVGHPVVTPALDFLFRSVRADGSWPIDTNLATWVTTLAVNALANHPDFETVLPQADRTSIRDWLLGQQYQREHPYTLAAPGGWAWTDLPGGVPDADDTPGALIALHHLGMKSPAVENAAKLGLRWLLNLQNRDGGMPTFCKGWGRLPFDKSSPDLTAHVLIAVSLWTGASPSLDRAIGRGPEGRFFKSAESFLANTQRDDGAWAPLWFGNQHGGQEENLTYGTTRVLRAFNVRQRSATFERGVLWLLDNQSDDGGWGGGKGTPSTIEESAWAVEALCVVTSYVTIQTTDRLDANRVRTAFAGGVNWLIRHTRGGRAFVASPLGFYFAKLWYFESLYPLVWSVSALGCASRIGSVCEPES